MAFWLDERLSAEVYLVLAPAEASTGTSGWPYCCYSIAQDARASSSRGTPRMRRVNPALTYERFLPIPLWCYDRCSARG